MTEENRPHAPARPRDEIHDSLVSIVVAPQTTLENVSHKSRFRSAKSTDAPKQRRDRDPKSETEEVIQAKLEISEAIPSPSDEESVYGSPIRAGRTPLTPHAELPLDPSYTFTVLDGPTETSLPISQSIIPESPYNPMQTPSFRHSPPPLPSDQPWRYPSPSHPLHSSTRDLSLTILTRPLPSPITKGIQLAESSPMNMLTLHSSPLSRSTPNRPSYVDFETPARSNGLGLRTLNRSYLNKGQTSSPLTAMKSYYGDHVLGSSPIPKYSTTSRHQRQSSDLSETWFSDNSLGPSSSTPLVSTTNDLFSIYNSWVEDARVSPTHVSKSRPEPDSPVLRCGSVALALGLLEPFSYPVDDVLHKELEVDIKEILETPVRRDHRPATKRSANFEDSDSNEITPPPKKRRKSQEN